VIIKEDRRQTTSEDAAVFFWPLIIFEVSGERGCPAMSGRNSRFGVQPIRGVVRRRHWNCKLIAYETGVGYSHLINAANGITAPSPELRSKLSEFLGLPVEKLFSTED
jgi:hypothetical protein